MLDGLAAVVGHRRERRRGSVDGNRLLRSVGDAKAVATITYLFIFSPQVPPQIDREKLERDAPTSTKTCRPTCIDQVQLKADGKSIHSAA